MKVLATVAIVFILTTFPACEEIPTNLKGLPPATMSGENTIGYRLNGSEFYNVKEGDAQLDWVKEDSLLLISAGFQDNSHISLSLPIANSSIKDYLVDSTATKETSAYFDSDSGCMYKVAGDSPRSASTMTIHFTRLNPNDPKDGIISGTFEMSLKAKDCPDVEIKDGRFDIEIGNGPRGLH